MEKKEIIFRLASIAKELPYVKKFILTGSYGLELLGFPLNRTIKDLDFIIELDSENRELFIEHLAKYYSHHKFAYPGDPIERFTIEGYTVDIFFSSNFRIGDAIKIQWIDTPLFVTTIQYTLTKKLLINKGKYYEDIYGMMKIIDKKVNP